MNTIRISNETDINIKLMSKKTGYSKTKIVEVVFRALDDKLIDSILLRNRDLLTKGIELKKWIKEEGKTRSGDGDNEDEDDYGDDSDIPFEDQICELCGEKNIECTCEDDIIEWDDDDEEEEEEKKLSRQECTKRKICFGCHKTITNCTCGNLEGFSPVVGSIFNE